MPQIWVKVLHTVQYIALDSGQTILEFHLYAADWGHVSAHRAIICLSFDTVIAHRAKSCLRFRTGLCTLGIIVFQISGTHNAHLAIMSRNFTMILHTGHSDAPVFGQTSAPRAKWCLRFGADFWKAEVITLFFQTDLSTFGTRCRERNSYHQKSKMNCP